MTCNIQNTRGLHKLPVEFGGKLNVIAPLMFKTLSHPHNGDDVVVQCTNGGCVHLRAQTTLKQTKGILCQGVYLEVKEKLWYCLPFVPVVLGPLFENSWNLAFDVRKFPNQPFLNG